MDSKSRKIYFLEINTNATVFYDQVSEFGAADHILAMVPGGHADFLHRILLAAMKMWEMKRKKYKVDYTPERGFHITAGQNFQAGDEVYTEENTPICLVSRKFVENAHPVIKDNYNRFKTAN